MSSRVALILAAGYSRRLGRAKRLIQLPTGQTLLEHAIATAHAAGFDVAVTLPPDADLADTKLASAWPIVVPDPAEGMAASVRTGITTLSADPTVHAVLVMLVDQWRLTAADLTTLTDTWRSTGHHVAAARYNGVVGVPAIFGREHFPVLAASKGDTGARDFLRSGDPSISVVDLANAEADLDSPADLAALG